MPGRILNTRNFKIDLFPINRPDQKRLSDTSPTHHSHHFWFGRKQSGLQYFLFLNPAYERCFFHKNLIACEMWAKLRVFADNKNYYPRNVRKKCRFRG
jgi:hypothetical protein